MRKIAEFFGRLVGALTERPCGPFAEQRCVAAFVAIVSVFISLYLLYGAYFGPQTALLERAVFYSAAGAGGLAMAALSFRHGLVRCLLYGLALVTLIPGVYLNQHFSDILMTGGIADTTDEILFVLTLISVFVLVRIYIGWTMVVLTLIAFAYAYFGHLIPGAYGHSPLTVGRLASLMLLTTDGIYGIPMGVAAQYIFLFSLLGTVMVRTGVGDVFVQLSYGLTGRVQGGPGVAAVLSSAMFGSINGSAVASAVTTGSFTIPLMKRTGYSATIAAAVEAAAASAGQILPPVMGAAAFLMAEMTNIPYRVIAIAALTPALLYVLAVLVAVRLEAGKENMGRLGADDVPDVRHILRTRSYLLLPLVALIIALAVGYTPMKAGAIAVVAALALTPWRRKTRLSLWQLVEICTGTLKVTISIIAAVAAAGAIIGVLTLTGLALQLSNLILIAGGNNLLLVLIYTMLASFVLGMGLPTSAAYLLLAILIAPALAQMGVPLLSAHMFIFYFGLVSAITPPVALAAYAAAGIAHSEPNATAIQAIRLGFVKLIVPFMFIYSPGVLLLGSSASIVGDIVFSALGIAGVATAFAGWIGRPLSWGGRAIWLVAGLACMFPSDTSVTAIWVYGARGVGLLLLLSLGCGVWRRRRTVAPLSHA